MVFSSSNHLLKRDFVKPQRGLCTAPPRSLGLSSGAELALEANISARPETKTEISKANGPLNLEKTFEERKSPPP